MQASQAPLHSTGRRVHFSTDLALYGRSDILRQEKSLFQTAAATQTEVYDSLKSYFVSEEKIFTQTAEAESKP